LVIVAILAYPKIFKIDTLEKLRSSGERISIAVMPFQNMTNDSNKNHWQDMIQEELITYLSNYRDELIIRDRETINDNIQSRGITNYASITPSIARTISQKLDANIFICGSIIQEGTVTRVNAQLFDSKTKEILKPFQIEKPTEKGLYL